MPTAAITPQTAAANSADIPIVNGTPAVLGLYTAAGGPVPAGQAFPVTRKNPAGTYDTTGTMLTSQAPVVVLTAPGTYRVEKPATDVAIGVNQD